ncbi:hypothetical protein N0V93_003831 [Gnomoniopsis smithogilvyi]|uniref:Yos1-domain-containing protein n=1 Tax=Gnomoniopsis smithogilvyi TaxID=1191159 RepID=A0A9W8Z168_9PEZI|nr:hypothetical protein N0V93_003831 [Gnomoniopsis smithogilvyi]
MFLFGNLLYTIILVINAIAILSEDRFLARIGFSKTSYDPAFGQGADQSVKGKIINLVASIRVIMRGCGYEQAQGLTHNPRSTIDCFQHFDNNLRAHTWLERSEFTARNGFLLRQQYRFILYADQGLEEESKEISTVPWL